MPLQVFRKFRLWDKADVPNTVPLPVISNPCECCHAGLGLGRWQEHVDKLHKEDSLIEKNSVGRI